MVQDCLLYHDGARYKLSAWVVMPNHIHFLLMPNPDTELSSIAHSIKPYTAHEANKILKRSGQFWQEEPFDRYTRDTNRFDKVVAYIENNPVKARLCEKPSDWKFSSAWYA